MKHSPPIIVHMAAEHEAHIAAVNKISDADAADAAVGGNRVQIAVRRLMQQYNVGIDSAEKITGLGYEVAIGKGLIVAHPQVIGYAGRKNRGPAVAGESDAANYSGLQVKMKWERWSKTRRQNG